MTITAENSPIPLSHKDYLDATFRNVRKLIHKKKIAEVRQMLSAMHAADLADFIDQSSNKIHREVIHILGKNLKAETLVWLSDQSKHSIEKIISYADLAKLVNELDAEDAIDTLEGFSNNTRDIIIDTLEHEKRHHIIEGLTHPEDSVGRIVEKHFISLHEHWTVGQALDYIRRNQFSQEFHAVVVADSKQRPVGTILLCKLMQSARNIAIQDIMNGDLKMVYSSTKIQELSYVFKQYALTIIPVVNKVGKVVGTVSIDNMLYILEQIAEGEVMHMAGLTEKDTFFSILKTSAVRFPWLFVNLLSACVTSMIINQFSSIISQLVALASIMPIVASMGGTSGAQVTTVTVKAISDKDITQANFARVVFKEIMVGVLNGLLLGAMASVAIYLLFHNWGLSLIFCIAVTVNFFIAGMVGSLVPIWFDRIKIDPAIASGVFVSATTDAMGFLIFLSLAYFFLV